MNEEQRQLTLLCAKRIIENHEMGRVVDKYGLEWAREYVANYQAMRQRSPEPIVDSEGGEL